MQQTWLEGILDRIGEYQTALTGAGGLGAALCGIGLQDSWVKGWLPVLLWSLGISLSVLLPTVSTKRNKLRQGREAAQDCIKKALAACGAAYGSPDRQVRANLMIAKNGRRRVCKAAKYDVIEEFRDEGVSGTKELEGRPGLAALLDRIDSNGGKVVIVERADRLARDLMVSEVILDQLTKAGAKVMTADGVDLSSAADDPTRTLIRQVLSAVAQFDKSVTVLKLRAARERLRRKGQRVEGRKPYGFRPDERNVLDQMRRLRERPRGERLSYEAIAAQLNEQGRTTRYGKAWTRAGVFQVLSR